jgi:hypothetical protein
MVVMVMSQVWKEMVPFVIKHIRSQLRDEEWAMITMDQYGSHVTDYGTLMMFRDSKILAYSPQSHSSHVTQPLDVNFFKPLKSAYGDVKDDYRLSSGGAKPNKWEIPGLVTAALRQVMGGSGGQRKKGGQMLAEAFRKCGLHPFNPNFVEENRHLTERSRPYDDGLEAAKCYVVVEGEEGVIGEEEDLPEGLVVGIVGQREGGEAGWAMAAVATVLGARRLHFTDLASNEVLLSVFQLIEDGPNVRLQHQDPFDESETLAEAWRGSEGKGFLTAFSRASLRAVREEQRLRKRKDAPLPAIFGQQNLTRSNVEKMLSSDNFEAAVQAYTSVLGLESEGVGMDMVRLVLVQGAPLAATVQETWKQAQSRKKGKKEGDQAGGGRQVNSLGESISTPKVLNSEQRLEAMRRQSEEHEASAAAQAEHERWLAGTLAPVITVLIQAGVLGVEHDRLMKPTMEQMKEYVNGDPARVLAFSKYRTAYRLQGKTTSYEYYFDFIHGGGVAHRVLINTGVPAPRIQLSASSLTKKAGQKNKQVMNRTLRV